MEGAISESLMSDIESSDSSSSESSISIPINGSFRSETFKKGKLSRRVINFITNVLLSAVVQWKHECARVENPGGGSSDFPQNSGGRGAYV